MNRQFWPLPIHYMVWFCFSLTSPSAAFCSGKHPLPAKRKRRWVQHFDPQIFVRIITAEMSGPWLHTGRIFYCSVLQQPDLVATAQIQHSPLTRRKRPSYSRTSPWEQADNYLKHRRKGGEKTSVATAYFTSIYKSHLQKGDYCRKIQCSQLAGKIPQL